MADKPKENADTDQPRPSLTVDWQTYADYLEDCDDLTDAQKRELIETLWGIIVEFVDFGFGIHPIQQIDEQHGIDGEELFALLSAQVNKNETPNQDEEVYHVPSDKGDNP